MEKVVIIPYCTSMSDRLHRQNISGTVQLRKSSPVTEVSMDESFNISSFDRGNVVKVKSMITIFMEKDRSFFFFLHL